MPGYFNSRHVCVCLVFLTLVLAPIILTCAPSKRLYSRLSDTEYTSPKYRIVLDKWTRKGWIHKGLGTELLITAPSKGGEFRRAFAGEYGPPYLQAPQESWKMMDDQIPASRSPELILANPSGSVTLVWNP